MISYFLHKMGIMTFDIHLTVEFVYILNGRRIGNGEWNKNMVKMHNKQALNS